MTGPREQLNARDSLGVARPGVNALLRKERVWRRGIRRERDALVRRDMHVCSASVVGEVLACSAEEQGWEGEGVG